MKIWGHIIVTGYSQEILEDEESTINSQKLTQMSIEPSSLIAKFASFCTSSPSQTSHAMPTTFACARFSLAKLPALAIPSFRFSSSSLTVACTDSRLP